MDDLGLKGPNEKNDIKKKAELILFTFTQIIKTENYIETQHVLKPLWT